MEWWKFNGYGFFVWGSYLAALAVVVIENAMLASRLARARREAADQVEHADHARRHANEKEDA
jgi:heme exporter protein CcmD